MIFFSGKVMVMMFPRRQANWYGRLGLILGGALQYQAGPFSLVIVTCHHSRIACYFFATLHNHNSIGFSPLALLKTVSLLSFKQLAVAIFGFIGMSLVFY